MPYSKSPTYTTNETKRIELATSIEAVNANNMSAWTDAYIENALVEKTTREDGDSYYTIKSRPKATKSPGSSLGGTTGRGCYAWSTGSFSDVFYVYDNHLYSISHGPVGNLSTSSGPCGFTDFLYSNGTSILVVSDGSYLYTVNSSYTFTTITSVVTTMGFHYPNPIYIDGYLFLAKQDTGDIYNSNLDDPTTWTAGNFITAEIYPDSLQGLSKNDNYLYAFGSSSVEFFYDAGNATGTPLARYASAVLQVGVNQLTRNTITQTDTSVMFVGVTSDGTCSAWSVDGFKPTKISTPAIDRLLQAGVTNVIPLSAYEMRVEGHKLYVITITGFYSLVYDTENKIWTKWTTNTSSSSTYNPVEYLGKDSCSEKFLDTIYVQDSIGVMYTLNLFGTKDGTNSFTTVIQTNEMDFDTYKKKFMSRFTLLIRQTSSSDTVSIRWTDDYYITWSNFRTLASGWTSFPFIFRLGSFRRRAFQIRITNDSANNWKLIGAEVDINKGNI